MIHLTVRAVSIPVPLTSHEVASWLWPRLRQAFPDVLAAALMPDHPHILASSIDAPSCQQRLKNVITGLRRSSNPGAAIRWARLAPADVVTDPKKVSRLVRYVVLNPTRAGLADDPLCWPWSTHRDVMGAVSDPWVTPARLARALGRDPRDFARQFHEYVSSDPSVRVDGTPAPRRAAPTEVAEDPLTALIDAAAATTRSLPADIRKRGPTRSLFLELASRHGWRDCKRLAEICGIGVRAVRRQWQRDAPAGLSAAELCLGDRRLRTLTTMEAASCMSHPR